MTKEEILDKLKYVVRTFVHRSDELSEQNGKEEFQAAISSIIAQDSLLEKIDKLPKTDYDWVTIEYEKWFREELANHPGIQKARQKVLRDERS